MLSILVCYKLKKGTRKKNNIAFWKAKHKWQRKTNGECTLAGLQCAAYKQLNICTFPIFQEHQGPHLWFLESGNYKASHVTKLLYSFHIAINTNLMFSFSPVHPTLPLFTQRVKSQNTSLSTFPTILVVKKGLRIKMKLFCICIVFSFCSRPLLHIKNVAWSEKNHRF